MSRPMTAVSPDPSARAPAFARARLLSAWRAAVVLLLLAVAPVAGLGAQQGGAGAAGDTARPVRSDPPQIHPEAERAIGRLKSPFCPGLMLEVCPSRDAAQLRDTLRTMAEAGTAADSLVAWTLARYGEEWSAVPEARGTDLLAWLVPPVAILLGGGIVFVALRRLRRREGDGTGAAHVPTLSEEEERRITEALSELEREGR